MRTNNITSFDEAKRAEGQLMTLLEMDNHMSSYDNDSLFGCGDGREAIECLMQSGAAQFSYAGQSENDGSAGFCVEFQLFDCIVPDPNYELPDEYFYIVKGIKVVINRVSEH